MPPRDDEVQALVEQLSAELNRSVLVDDASLRLLAYSPTLGSRGRGAPHRDPHARDPARHPRPALRAGDRDRDPAGAHRPRPDIGLESRVCVPIRCQGALFGYLWLIDADQSLTDADCQAAERCAAEIGTAMYRRDELEKPQREHELRLLEQLLGADAAAARDGRARARGGRSAGRRGRHRRARGASAAATTSRSWIGRARAARARAGPVPPRAAAPPGAQHGRRRPRRDGRRACPSAAALVELARRAQEALDGVRRAVRASATAASTSTCATRTARTSTRGWRCGSPARCPSIRTPAGWEDLGAYRLLARAAETPHARELIHPGLPKLFALHSKESLVQTLEAYLDNGCDTKLTAEALFLHRAQPLLPPAAHRGHHGDLPQERRRPARAALRAQARTAGGHTSGAETYQHRLASLRRWFTLPRRGFRHLNDEPLAARPISLDEVEDEPVPIGGGRKICAHIEWPYSAARRCSR